MILAWPPDTEALNTACVVYSLKNHGADEEVEAMFEMGAETMALPLDEKMAYEQGDSGNNFG